MTGTRHALLGAICGAILFALAVPAVVRHILEWEHKRELIADCRNMAHIIENKTFQNVIVNTLPHSCYLFDTFIDSPLYATADVIVAYSQFEAGKMTFGASVTPPRHDLSAGNPLPVNTCDSPRSASACRLTPSDTAN